MPTTNAYKTFGPNKLMWCFLAEYSLSKFLDEPGTGDWTASGLLSQTVRELGIPVERLENVEMTLRSLSREALRDFKQESVEFSGRIRIFCQQKMIDEEMKGGWGYFIIDRSGDEASSSGKSHPLIDLYLYREGG